MKQERKWLGGWLNEIYIYIHTYLSGTPTDSFGIEATNQHIQIATAPTGNTKQYHEKWGSPHFLTFPQNPIKSQKVTINISKSP